MKLTEEKLTYLLFLYEHQSSVDTATKMANHLGISKSTFSRVLLSFFEMGWTISKGKGILSKRGMQIARKLNKDIDNLASWLITEGGLNYQEAQKEARVLILTISEEAKEKLLHRSSMAAFYKSIEHVKQLNGDFLCANLEDGIYPFAFTIYKDIHAHPCQISMANEGFYHPGKFIIKEGLGELCLYIKEIEHVSKIGNLVLKGKLSHLLYWEDGKFVEARMVKDHFCIPVCKMIFYYNREERVMQGSVWVKVRADVGIMHMPVRTATLIVYFK